MAKRGSGGIRQAHENKPAVAGRPRPLTHEERLAVINAPWPTVNVVVPKSWAGTILRHGIGADTMPEEGRRVYSPTPEDEQWFQHIAGE